MKKRILLVFSILLSSLVLLLLIDAVSSICGGYEENGICYEIGDEVRKNGNYYYVDASGSLQPQKADGASCQNDFECLNNLCSNQVCEDIYKEAKRAGDLARQVEERTRDLEFRYDISIFIQTEKDIYAIGEVIKLG